MARSKGVNANVIEIRSSHVTLRGPQPGPTRADVDGVRIFAVNGITIERCEFAGLEGIAIVATTRACGDSPSESTASFKQRARAGSANMIARSV